MDSRAFAEQMELRSAEDCDILVLDRSGIKKPEKLHWIGRIRIVRSGGYECRKKRVCAELSEPGGSGGTAGGKADGERRNSRGIQTVFR